MRLQFVLLSIGLALGGSLASANGVSNSNNNDTPWGNLQNQATALVTSLQTRIHSITGNYPDYVAAAGQLVASLQSATSNYDQTINQIANEVTSAIAAIRATQQSTAMNPDERDILVKSMRDALNSRLYGGDLEASYVSSIRQLLLVVGSIPAYNKANGGFFSYVANEFNWFDQTGMILPGEQDTNDMIAMIFSTPSLDDFIHGEYEYDNQDAAFVANANQGTAENQFPLCQTSSCVALLAADFKYTLLSVDRDLNKALDFGEGYHIGRFNSAVEAAASHVDLLAGYAAKYIMPVSQPQQ